jgi:aryl-alcohol dehydrogenase-like predicted oxidoreductase
MSLSGVYGESNDEEAVYLIRYALDQGVTLLDSADMYGWALERGAGRTGLLRAPDPTGEKAEAEW